MLIIRAPVTKAERWVDVVSAHAGIHAATVTQQWGPAIHQEWGPVLGAETPGWSTADDCNADYMLQDYSRLFQFSRLNIGAVDWPLFCKICRVVNPLITE